MADAVQHAINDSRRVPNLILTAHVHNYQRIERQFVKNKPTPFLVAGHGGYYHLHHLNMGIAPGAVDPNTKAELKAASASKHGYVTLTVDANEITGSMTTVDTATGTRQDNVDTFTYTARPIALPPDVVVSL